MCSFAFTKLNWRRISGDGTSKLDRDSDSFFPHLSHVFRLNVIRAMCLCTFVLLPTRNPSVNLVFKACNVIQKTYAVSSPYPPFSALVSASFSGLPFSVPYLPSENPAGYATRVVFPVVMDKEAGYLIQRALRRANACRGESQHHRSHKQLIYCKWREIPSRVWVRARCFVSFCLALHCVQSYYQYFQGGNTPDIA
jgi:hypothetical protein